MTPEPVVVKSFTGVLTAAGVWTGVIGGLTALAVAIVRQWGPWRKLASEDRAADFERLRGDIERQQGQIDRLESKVDTAEADAREAREKAVRSDASLKTAITACELLLALCERELPDAREIPMVKRLLAQAASDDMGIGKAMRQLARVKGTGE